MAHAADAVIEIDAWERSIKGVTIQVRILADRYTHAVAADVLAAAPGCGDLTLKASPALGWFRGSASGVALGVPGFDRHYTLTASDPLAARWWLTPEAAEAVDASFAPGPPEPFALHLEPGRVWMRSVGRPVGTDARTGELAWAQSIPLVERAIAAVALVARRNRALATAWRTRLTPYGLIDAGDVWQTDRDYQLVVARGRHRLVIDFPWRAPPLQRAGLRTRLMIPWDAPEPAAVAAVPHPLAALGADWFVRGGGALAVGWERVIDDATVLAAGLAILASWAEHANASDGPYR